MPLQLSETLRNNRGSQVESTIGASPSLVFRTGAQPANCAAADAGTVVVSIPLPADWLTAPSGGVYGLNGTWPSTNATGDGPIGHFRVMQGGTCHMQGSVTNTGGGGDMTVQNVSVNTGQPVEVTGFQLTEPNA